MKKRYSRGRCNELIKHFRSPFKDQEPLIGRWNDDLLFICGNEDGKDSENGKDQKDSILI